MKTQFFTVNGRRREYVIQNELIKRGWTRNMIKKFLVYEDYSKPNHIRFNYHDLKYYLVDRVLKLESKDEFYNYCVKYILKD